MCKLRNWTQEEIKMLSKQLNKTRNSRITIIECPDNVFRDVCSVKRIISQWNKNNGECGNNLQPKNSDRVPAPICQEHSKEEKDKLKRIIKKVNRITIKF